ncbi:quinon protein alcohol dehydrogenase-like superfamily [Hyaloraphidium curvatum]|nr:quinon protein alcohol dehydrogenase-like superfamily [Hyaloraphidium curvatum]
MASSAPPVTMPWPSEAQLAADPGSFALPAAPPAFLSGTPLPPFLPGMDPYGGSPMDDYALQMAAMDPMGGMAGIPGAHFAQMQPEVPVQLFSPDYVLVNGIPMARDGTYVTEQFGGPGLPFGTLAPSLYGDAGEGAYVEPAPSILPTRIFAGSKRWIRTIAVDAACTGLVAAGDDARIRIWDLVTGQLATTLRGHRQPVYSLAIEPATGTIFSGALDGALLAHDPRMRRPVAEYHVHTDALKSLATKHDGTKLYSAGYDGRLAEWDPRFPEPRLLLKSSSEWLRGLTLDHSEMFAYVVDSGRALRCIHIPSGRLKWLQRSDTEPIRSVHLDSTARFLYTGGQDASIIQWDAVTGEPQGSLESHRGWITGLATHPASARRLFSVSLDTTIKEWDLGRGTLTTTWEPKCGPVEQVVMDPTGKGRMWTVGQDGGVREWRVPEAWWLMDGEEGMSEDGSSAGDGFEQSGEPGRSLAGWEGAPGMSGPQGGDSGMGR